MAAEKLRDLSQPIDVPLLDATVAAFYGTGSKEEVLHSNFEGFWDGFLGRLSGLGHSLAHSVFGTFDFCCGWCCCRVQILQ